MLHLILSQVLPSSPLEWALTHLQLLGWPTLCFLAWKISGYFQKALHQITKTVEQIDTMSTNHMPHVQDGILELVVLTKAANEKLDNLIDVLKG